MFKRYTGLRALLSAVEFQLRLCVPEELLLTAVTISSANLMLTITLGDKILFLSFFNC